MPLQVRPPPQGSSPTAATCECRKNTALGRGGDPDIIGDGRDPEVVLTVITAPATDLQALHHRIEAEPSPHAQQAIGNPSLP
jgi:hypothetical protein